MESLSAIIGLFVVILLIVVLIYMLKKVMGHSLLKNQDMVVLSQLPIGNKERVVLLQVKSKLILIGATNHQISALHVFDSTQNLN